MTKDSTNIESLLASNGPCLSSSLRRALAKNGISDAAARQRISRAKGRIRRLKAIPFQGREQFLYLPEQLGSVEYSRALIDALRQSNTPHGLAIDSLIANGGAVHRPRWDVISGSPARLRRRISSVHVLDALVAAGLADLRGHPMCGDFVALSEKCELAVLTPHELMARGQTVSILLAAIRSWVTKMGLGSWNSVQVRNQAEAPQFGPFRWDVTGPSYVIPLAKRAKNSIQPGFVAVDVSFPARVTRRAAESFLQKCAITRAFPKIPPFMAMLVADGFDGDAFPLRSSQGALFVTPDTLFGEGVSEGLRMLVGTLSNAAAAAIKNPDQIQTLFERLSAIEGAAGNLRGPLFELIVMRVVHLDGGSVDHQILVHDPEDASRVAEIDVFRVKGKEVVSAYECRGLGPGASVPLADIKHWLEDRVPLIRKHLISQARFQSVPLVFEFWTTGSIDKDAVNYLSDRKARLNPAKYQISWLDGASVLERVKQKREKSLIKVLNEHYFRHPIAQAVKQALPKDTKDPKHLGAT